MPSNPDKTIISDTTCLIGLTNIGQINILREIYGSIIITPEVMKEYRAPLPEWIVTEEVKDTRRIALFDKFLGLGEASAIALAMETKNSLLIVDDRRARQYALDLGLEIIGTLGLLIKAYENGLIPDIDSIVANLRGISFRLPPDSDALIKTIKKK
jgi:predicted nucleic acid-binding protein